MSREAALASLSAAGWLLARQIRQASFLELADELCFAIASWRNGATDLPETAGLSPELQARVDELRRAATRLQQDRFADAMRLGDVSKAHRRWRDLAMRTGVEDDSIASVLEEVAREWGADWVGESAARSLTQRLVDALASPGLTPDEVMVFPDVPLPHARGVAISVWRGLGLVDALCAMAHSLGESALAYAQWSSASHFDLLSSIQYWRLANDAPVQGDQPWDARLLTVLEQCGSFTTGVQTAYDPNENTRHGFFEYEHMAVYCPLL